MKIFPNIKTGFMDAELSV